MYPTREHSGSNWNLEVSAFRRTGVPGEKPLGLEKRTNNKLETVWKEVRVNGDVFVIPL